MEIKVLGTGCSNCRNLEKNVKKALSELNIEAEVEKVEEISRIISYGIMLTPALVINGKVVLYGRVPSLSELKKIITVAKG
jgi:small redox-active disulfide protein 2